MKNTVRTTVLAGLALATVTSPALADTPKEVAVAEMASLFATFDQEAAGELIAPDLIQHNLTIPTGGEVLIGFIPALRKSGISATTHRLIARRRHRCRAQHLQQRGTVRW